MGNPDALYKWIVVSIIFNGFFEERHFSATHSSPHPRPSILAGLRPPGVVSQRNDLLGRETASWKPPI